MATRRHPRRAPAVRRIQLDPRAVANFYNRQLEDFRWLKEVPREELLKLVPEGFTFIKEPYTHQLACFVIGMKMPRFLYLLEMGSGKSGLLLNLIRYRKWRGELHSALICVPNLINLASWENQIKIHAPDLSYKILSGSKATREKLLDEDRTDVAIINYAGLGVYMASARKWTKKGTQKRDVVAEDIQRFINLFNFCAFDESHLGIGSVTSLQYKICKELSWAADFAYGATGTPMGKEPAKMWPQFHVVDRGETLGYTLTMFRAAFYEERESYWAGVEYVFEEQKRSHLHQMTQHRSIRYTDTEFSDMPALMPAIPIYVQMSPAQMKRNQELITQAREAQKEGLDRPATFIKQRQTTAGFIAVKGEDGTKLEVSFSPNPKIDALEQFILELDPAEKLVIFHSYVYTGALIRALLDKMKIKFCGVGAHFKDPALELRRFMTDKGYRIFIANCAAGATGIDGLQQVCRYALFVESPTGPILRRQAEKRIHRDGQKKRCHIYDLIARGISVDQRVLDSIAEGKDLFSAIVNGDEEIY